MSARKVEAGANVAAQVRGWVGRIERLDGEIKGLNADKTDVYAEAKAAGIDPNAIRDAMRFRRNPEAAVERSAAMQQVLAMLDTTTEAGTAVATHAGAPARSAAEGGE